MGGSLPWAASRALIAFSVQSVHRDGACLLQKEPCQDSAGSQPNLQLTHHVPHRCCHRVQAIDAVNQALLFTCEGLTADASTEITSGVAPTLLDSSVSAAKAFSLSSRPSTIRKIYLDFDGHITEGTDWNSNKGISSIVTPAFDKDGNPSSWSADELSDIVAIWRAGEID